MTTQQKLIEKMEEYINLSDAISAAIPGYEGLDDLIGKRINLRLEISSLKAEIKKEDIKIEYICTDCGHVNHLKYKKGIRVGYCKKCEHPLWNDIGNESEVDKESEQPKKKRLIYHLNCDKCDNLYWCGEGFPEPQLCKKCEESEQSKLSTSKFIKKHEDK